VGSRGVLTRRGDEVRGGLPGLLEDWPFEHALRFASAMGASCTRALGCTDGVFRFEEAAAFVDQMPLPITRLR